MQFVLCILASIGGIFLKIHVSHFTRFRYNNANFVVIRQYLSTLFLNSNAPCFPNHGFHEMDLLENPSVEPHTH